MKKKMIVANLKAHLSPEKTLQWAELFMRALGSGPQNLEIIVAAPTLVLERLQQKMSAWAGMSLAAQELSPYPPGSYTGALPAAWLRGLAQYALLGHPERRTYFHESIQDVARQVRESLNAGLTPLVCVDEDNFSPQLAALSDGELDRLAWVYSPKNAASLEMSRDGGNIAAAAAQIGKRGGNRPVLYTGGVRADNLELLWNVAGLSGVMVGAASLDGAGFASMIRSIARS